MKVDARRSRKRYISAEKDRGVEGKGEELRRGGGKNEHCGLEEKNDAGIIQEGKEGKYWIVVKGKG